MTSCDKRLEELLNRAGQTISDLPKIYTDTECIRAETAGMRWCRENEIFPLHESEQLILHLTDIIDRMEWALENVIGELDWLRFMLCEICDMEPNGASCKYCIVKKRRSYD